MPIERTLVAVDELIAAGDLRAARTKLRDLVLQRPQRLDLRERLAAVYRREGNLAQAGRWGYLAEYRDAVEDRAFERCFQDDPVQIMAALHWRGQEGDASGAVAKARLVEIRNLAQAAAGEHLTWEDPLQRHASTATHPGCLAAGVVVLALAFALVVVGAATVFDWVVG